MEITHNTMPEALGMIWEEVKMLRQQVSQLEPVKEKEQFFGIAGIAKILNCCNTTAQRVKNTGYIDGALYQAGRQILIDKEKLQELYKENEFKIKKSIKKSLTK
jgi:hypothetical protein